MIEKGKISAFQMAVMMFATIITTAALFLPGLSIKYAGRDMWLSAILASLIGFLTVYIACQLNKFFPKQTIIQYSEKLLGSIFGKMISFLFLFVYLHITGIMLREYAEFYVANFLTLTPIIVMIGSMVLTCALSVRAGLEVVARTAQALVPLILFAFFLVTIFLLPDYDIGNIFPVMEKGIAPSIKGAMATSIWFSEFIIISFFLPFLTDRTKGMKWGLISVLVTMLFIVVILVNTLSILGDVTENFTYPAWIGVEYIRIGEFLEHMEVLIMTFWVAGTFIKISVFYYVIVLGTAQWLKLSDYRPLVLPIGFLLVIFGIWIAPNLQSLFSYMERSLIFYMITFQVIFPLILLLVAMIQKNKLKIPSNTNS